MIYLINKSGIAVPVATLEEATRLLAIHDGSKIAIGFNPKHVTVAWRNVLAEIDYMARQQHELALE